MLKFKGKRISLPHALGHAELLGPYFQGDSWARWRILAKAQNGEPLSADELAIFLEHTERKHAPEKPVRESWIVCGRGAGKSRFTSAEASIRAAVIDYSPILAPGEKAYVGLFAADRAQAKILFSYIDGIFSSVALLKKMVINRTAETIELNNRVIIQVKTNSYRTLRGPRYVFAAADEIAFWRSEQSANPDEEIINALRPSLARTSGSLLMAISSPYARRGMLWKMYQKYFGKDDDRILVWQGDTLSMNPTFDEQEVARAILEDESSADAEYGAEFRKDLEDFVSIEAVEGCIGEYGERGYNASFSYGAFCDVAGGSGQDSYTMAIGHKEGSKVYVDAIHETRPPFSPEQVTDAYSDILRGYGVREVFGDRYAGSWPAEQFGKRGIRYKAAEKSKSDLYIEALPAINSGNVELPRNERLIRQLTSLERRTGRGSGKDVIDHSPGGHDDIANAVAGLITTLGSRFVRAPGDLGYS